MRILLLLYVLLGAVTGNAEISDDIFIADRAGYGSTWMYFPDGNGVPQIAILKEHHTEMYSSRNEVVEDITFWLYTRANPDNGQKLQLDASVLQTTHFDSEKETKFLVHGWMSSGSSTTILNMRDAYLRACDCNVVAVDWSTLAASNLYWFSKTQIPTVGKELGHLILFLESNGARMADMHLVGHSLGAHVVGFAGYSIQPERKVARITGLDPALPGFQYYEYTEGRLDESDAEFVQVIHTCSGALGYTSPIGNADFYPNGGTPFQPGCCCLPEVVQACSHGRSHEYFTESITSDVGFYGLLCESWSAFTSGVCRGQPVIMGDKTPQTTKGVFYLATNSSAPFALGLP